MFFEVLNKETNEGDIGLATSDDALKWTYRQIVLDEPFHLSFPQVFKWRNEYYMLLETQEAGEMRLYKAIDFPVRWTFVKTVMKGRYADPAIFYFDDRWWIFAQTRSSKGNILSLYYANDPTGPWVAHPNNRIIAGDGHIARPGGRVITIDGKLI
jgi:hypothetical protein